MPNAQVDEIESLTDAEIRWLSRLRDLMKEPPSKVVMADFEHIMLTELLDEYGLDSNWLFPWERQ